MLEDGEFCAQQKLFLHEIMKCMICYMYFILQMGHPTIHCMNRAVTYHQNQPDQMDCSTRASLCFTKIGPGGDWGASGSEEPEIWSVLIFVAQFEPL